MRPSEILNRHRQTIRETALKFRTANSRIFGSVVRGTDSEGSDLDLLVDALPETTLFDLGGLQEELETRLGIKVDVCTPADLPPLFRSQAWNEAVPL